MSESPIAPGTTLQDGTVVGEYLGRSAAALNFVAKHPTHGDVVIKVLAPALEEPLAANADAIRCLFGVRHPNLQTPLAHGHVGPRHYLAYAFVEGQSLRATLDHVAAGSGVDLTTALHLHEQLLDAVEALHDFTPHGVLTSDNIYLTRTGDAVVANTGFARLALQAADDPAYAATAYVAPEVVDDPWAASETSDVYSLGVILVALLSGQDPPRERLQDLAEQVCEAHPAIADVIRTSVNEEQVMRFTSVAELRQALRAANETPVTPSIPSIPKLRLGVTAEEDADRWITSINSRDFGPYGSDKIREMLRADEIDENTMITDVFTQETVPLIDVPTFTDFVIDYIPERAKRRLAQDERRKEVVKQAKRTGTTTIVASALAVLAGAAAFFAMQVDSPPVPFADIVQVYAHTFELDEPTYVEIAADDALIASLFDFSDPVPEEPEEGRTRRSRSSGDEPRDDGAEPSLDDYVVSFDNSRPSRKLSNDEIHGTLASNQSSIQRCFQPELRSNPRFEGVSVSWSIVPDGRTTSIRVSPYGTISDDASSCVRRAFRRMQFPEFNDVPMNVTIPFRLQ